MHEAQVPGPGFPPFTPPGGPGGGSGGAGAGSGGGGGKPITGGPRTVALHVMQIDPNTGLPRGEKPPASTASVVSIVCGFLLCLGPVLGIAAIVAGILGRRAARAPDVGGGTLSLVGIVLGVLNVLGWGMAMVLWALSQLF